MSDKSDSIFRRYYSQEQFQDRFLTDPADAMDVVIPVIHTNELWEKNLISIYREVPVNRLLIGDGGCLDDSIVVAQRFPRVQVFDHKSYVSLGYSIRKLIEAVETEWFIYLHSDVYLPDGWFDTMKRYRSQYDWFGCPMQHTIMVEYRLVDNVRPYAGSQIGRKAAFEKGLSRIDDDYVYRQEDFIFENVVASAGFKNGRVEDAFHYHQTLRKPSKWERKVQKVGIQTEQSREEELRTWTMQGKGIIKYLMPTSDWVISEVRTSVRRLSELGGFDLQEFRRWTAATNPAWLPYVSKRRPLRQRVGAFLRAARDLARG